MNELQAGVFLSPKAADLGRLRDNVHAAEEAGFDFISVQDHPYVPDFLDTFALIGALIGQTSRIRFMTNVANLPLRPPQMLAKASASLDVLSGGRFELGVGAGRAWPQIVGLGGPARRPAEALGAVAEAIDVLRALWTPGRIVDLPGHFYPVRAQSGPAPAHRIGIWLGAVGPKMLDVTGRKADGWMAPLATGYEAKPGRPGPDRRRRPCRRPGPGQHPPRHPARRHCHRRPQHRQPPSHRAGRPADPHHPRHLGQDHHRVRRRAAVRHRQPDTRAGDARAAPTVRLRGDTASPCRSFQLITWRPASPGCRLPGSVSLAVLPRTGRRHPVGDAGLSRLHQGRSARTAPRCGCCHPPVGEQARAPQPHLGRRIAARVGWPASSTPSGTAEPTRSSSAPWSIRTSSISASGATWCAW